MSERQFFDKPIHLWLAELTEPQVGSPISTGTAMELAAAAAYRGCGSTRINPLVGCVLVDREHRFVASGAHLKWGQAHAEVNALAEAELRGLSPRLAHGTAYVTLEPCSHVGKTPPCATALAGSSLAEVVYAVPDPNPLVSGKGIELLKAAGKSVRSHPYFERLVRPALESFLFSIGTQKTFLALKAATSVNSLFARKMTARFRITGEKAIAYGHWLRGFYDGIIVGAGTVLADNPKLNCRSAIAAILQSPRPIILDWHGELADKVPFLALTQNSQQKPIWVVSEQAARPLEVHSHLIEVLEIPRNLKRDESWDYLQHWLFQQGLQRCMIEGGGEVWRSALRAMAASRLHQFLSMQYLMVPDGKQFLGQTGDEEISVAITNPETFFLGPDLLIEGRLQYGRQAFGSI